MFEKVNKYHPDKLADRIGAALVDEAYRIADNPKIAVEVLIGHGVCHIIAETSEKLDKNFVFDVVHRITRNPNFYVIYDEYLQDSILANNQLNEIRCGDNGIFKGVPVTEEQRELCRIAHKIEDFFPTDGKYILDGNKLTICQSCASERKIRDLLKDEKYELIINPLGEWTGGPSVDTGVTGRKLGSDMGDSITGGNINAKDLSKADVSLNIYAFLKAQETGKEVNISCSIGDNMVDGRPYDEIVEIAKKYIDDLGGFEKFSEWGLIR